MKRVNLVRPSRSIKSYVKETPSTEVRKPVGSPVDQLLDQAAKLAPELRKEFLARLALNAQTLPSGETRDVDMWAGAVYDAIVAANGGEDGGLVGPAQIKRSLAVPASWSSVATFMKTSRLDQLTVTERQSIYVMLASLVVGSARSVARKARIPLSGKLVANCATNVASIFDQSFPGYLESGLALLVAKRWTSREAR